jgi:hypothetical protein
MICQYRDQDHRRCTRSAEHPGSHEFERFGWEQRAVAARPSDVVQTVEERRHTLAALALVALLTVVIFAVAAAADLGSWFVS